MADYSLDARGLLCPMPVIRAQDKVSSLSAGDRLTVYCSDPGATNDIPAWCRINGHEVININEQDGDIIITVKVGAQ